MEVACVLLISARHILEQFQCFDVVIDTMTTTPFIVCMQVFAAEEKDYQAWCWWKEVSQRDSLAAVKTGRLAVAEALLRAGADRHAKSVVARHPARCGTPQHEGMLDHAEGNPTSGGPEVVLLLSSVWAQPRSLQSSCRLVIRKCLARPILRHCNVNKLPLPSRVKDYVSMNSSFIFV